MRTIPVTVPLVAFSSLVALLASACGPDGQASDAQRSDTPSVQIDHVIVAVGDLETGMDAFEELTGVRPILGGEHPGRGTRNALVSLGPLVYLELLAPQDGVETVEDAPGLADLTELTPCGWGASTTDLEATLGLLGTEGYGTSDLASGSRATPDGGLLEWRTGMVEEPAILGAPFFIEWGVDSPHPATTSPGGCELEAMKVMTPNDQDLRTFVQILELPVEVEAAAGSAEEYRLILRCPAGTVTFR
jgi:hypothetical protein